MLLGDLMITFPFVNIGKIASKLSVGHAAQGLVHIIPVYQTSLCNDHS